VSRTVVSQTDGAAAAVPKAETPAKAKPAKHNDFFHDVLGL
jgi:hypothetical protein